MSGAAIDSMITISGGPGPATTSEERLRDLFERNLRMSGFNPHVALEVLDLIVGKRAWESLGFPDLPSMMFSPFKHGGAEVDREQFELLLGARHPHERDPEVRAHYDELREAVRRMLDEPLAEVGRPKEGEGITEGGDNVANSNITGSGTEATYTRRRLLRDRPDLYERVVTGELSANAAAIEAGFRTKTKTIRIDSAEAAVAGLLRVFSAEELRDALAAKGES